MKKGNSVNSTIQPCIKKHSGSGDTYTAQCGKCFKWRVIDAQEEFEEIRARLIEDPFACSKKPNTSCDDPADIEYDNSQTWVIDKSNLPKSPPGFKRKVTLRKHTTKGTRMDVIYRAPNGKQLRSSNDVAKFLEEYPEYAEGISASDVSFTRPKIMMNMPPVKRIRSEYPQEKGKLLL